MLAKIFERNNYRNIHRYKITKIPLREKTITKFDKSFSFKLNFIKRRN
jgi:hypothetical protein